MNFTDIILLAALEIQAAFRKHYHVVAQHLNALRDNPSYHKNEDNDDDEQDAADSQDIEKELEERHLWLEEREKIRTIRKEFDLLVAKTRNTETQFKELLDYVQRYYTGRKPRKERRFIVKRYLCSLFERKQGMLIVQKEAESLCQLATVLFVKAELDFSELKWILNQVEFKKEAA